MDYQKNLINNNIQCLLCPRKCVLAPDSMGYCLARKNINGKIQQSGFGYSSGFAIDPVEKKPLFHFLPTSKTFSFGTFGCNMGCVFCQNYHISKIPFSPENAVMASPEQVVLSALKYGCKSISFTYNEPIIFYQYAKDVAKIAHEYGLKTIAVTAGYILPEPRKDFFSHIDAFNIDLKGFTSDFYKKFCNADISFVLDTIDYVANQTDSVLELTTLLIPDENDDSEMLKREYDWILKNLGKNIPLHLSAFHPDYKLLEKEKTDASVITSAYNLAKQSGLNYVYSGNIADASTSVTSCPKCGFRLITRNYYDTSVVGLNGNKCANCGQEIYGIF